MAGRIVGKPLAGVANLFIEGARAWPTRTRVRCSGGRAAVRRGRSTSLPRIPARRRRDERVVPSSCPDTGRSGSARPCRTRSCRRSIGTTSSSSTCRSSGSFPMGSSPLTAFTTGWTRSSCHRVPPLLRPGELRRGHRRRARRIRPRRVLQHAATPGLPVGGGAATAEPMDGGGPVLVDRHRVAPARRDLVVARGERDRGGCAAR